MVILVNILRVTVWVKNICIDFSHPVIKAFASQQHFFAIFGLPKGPVNKLQLFFFLIFQTISLILTESHGSQILRIS